MSVGKVGLDDMLGALSGVDVHDLFVGKRETPLLKRAGLLNVPNHDRDEWSWVAGLHLLKDQSAVSAVAKPGKGA